MQSEIQGHERSWRNDLLAGFGFGDAVNGLAIRHARQLEEASDVTTHGVDQMTPGEEVAT